jgi:hypothetical protein
MACVAVLSGPAQARRFFPDDPIDVDPDTLRIAPPAEVELSTFYDVYEHTLKHRPDGAPPPARSANTLGDVPNSSWFTNRIGMRDLSIEELVRGPNTTEGPDTSAPLTIISGKSGGITPGFTVQDARGDVYFIKFDPMKYPRLSTAPDVIVSKIFYALGYSVPENHIAYLDPATLTIGPKAKVSIPGKGKQPMGPEYLNEILSKASKQTDGRIRVVASRRLSGTPVGPFKFHGTRGDDPNDVIPHEHRRELRGYRVFCAWLNHDDSRSINSLDMYVPVDSTSGAGGWVKHHLIDFSSTLGSGSNPDRQIAPQNPRAGNEYMVEWAPFFKTALSLGLWERPWRKVKYPYPVYAELGRIESTFFEPHKWKPEYPNPAFERMRLDDAFWAAKLVARFSDEAIAALVHTGEYADPEAEAFLVRTLSARRDKIVRYYFAQVNPLDAFELAGSELRFKNLGAEYGVTAAEGYDIEWFGFDNASEASTPAGKATSAEAAVAIPAAAFDAAGDHVLVRIRTRAAALPAWNKAVDVYVRKSDRKIVGIEREL